MKVFSLGSGFLLFTSKPSLPIPPTTLKLCRNNFCNVAGETLEMDSA